MKGFANFIANVPSGPFLRKPGKCFFPEKNQSRKRPFSFDWVCSLSSGFVVMTCLGQPEVSKQNRPRPWTSLTRLKISGQNLFSSKPFIFKLLLNALWSFNIVFNSVKVKQIHLYGNCRRTAEAVFLVTHSRIPNLSMSKKVAILA